MVAPRALVLEQWVAVHGMGGTEDAKATTLVDVTQAMLKF